MKILLISNDEDILVGMRLAGIEGKFVTEKEELVSSLEEAVHDHETGLVLVNSSLALCAEKEITVIKKNSKMLVVEIPDEGSTAETDSITRYVRDAIGLKI